MNPSSSNVNSSHRGEKDCCPLIRHPLSLTGLDFIQNPTLIFSDSLISKERFQVGQLLCLWSSFWTRQELIFNTNSVMLMWRDEISSVEMAISIGAVVKPIIWSIGFNTIERGIPQIVLQVRSALKPDHLIHLSQHRMKDGIGSNLFQLRSNWACGCPCFWLNGDAGWADKRLGLRFVIECPLPPVVRARRVLRKPMREPSLKNKSSTLHPPPSFNREASTDLSETSVHR